MRKSERSDEEHGRENRPTKNQSNDPRSIADVRQDKESNRAMMPMQAATCDRNSIER